MMEHRQKSGIRLLRDLSEFDGKDNCGVHADLPKSSGRRDIWGPDIGSPPCFIAPRFVS
jgi:hypothetical protein